MADGLRLLGSCPRCGGEVVFAEDAPKLEEDAAVPDVNPARVLGVPRRT